MAPDDQHDETAGGEDESEQQSPGRPSYEPRWHHAQFEKETRERLAKVETTQEQIDDKTDDIRDGQQEILDRVEELRHNHVSEDDFEELEETVKENAMWKLRVRTGIILITTLASITGAIGGAVFAAL